MLKILLVKTSSLGDVIHQLPAVTDIRTHFPDARVDWVVEENFAELPALHPGVSRVIPVALRRWRRALLHPAAWREMAAFRRALQSLRYDMVLDSQGLIKSAAITLLAPGPRCGYDRASAREPIAALAYDKTIAMPKNLHAVERNRRLAGRALGYEPDTPVDYGVATPQTEMPWLTAQPYVVLLHATSRADKEWPEADWLALAAHLHAAGMRCILPWGSPQEQARSERLAAQMANAIVAAAPESDPGRRAAGQRPCRGRRRHRADPSCRRLESAGGRALLRFRARVDRGLFLRPCREPGTGGPGAATGRGHRGACRVMAA